MKEKFRLFNKVLPQVLLLPYIHIATKGEEGLNYRFWVSVLMVYVLYVCFSQLHQLKTNEELKDSERTILSGLVSYSLISFYVALYIFQNKEFLNTTYCFLPYLFLQIWQYAYIIKNYRILKKIS